MHFWYRVGQSYEKFVFRQIKITYNLEPYTMLKERVEQADLNTLNFWYRAAVVICHQIMPDRCMHS
jgi:hypothetical protein